MEEITFEEIKRLQRGEKQVFNRVIRTYKNMVASQKIAANRGCLAGRNKAPEALYKISPAKAITEFPEFQSQPKNVFKNQVTAGRTTIRPGDQYPHPAAAANLYANAGGRGNVGSG